MSGATELAQMGKVVFPCGSDKRPLVKWRDAATTDLEQIVAWRTKWPNAMIGLPCGQSNGLTVIDLDLCKNTGKRLGEESFRRLGLGHLLTGQQVRTPSGGLHLYFRHWDGARNSASKLAPGVDVRAEGGFVIASGSVSPAGTYTGTIDWNALPSLPLSLRALLTTPPPKPKPTYDTAPAASGEIAELLSHISPDLPYGEWVTVLMALHDRFSGSDEGLGIAVQWSSTGAKFRPGEIEVKWRGFKGSGVTFASLPAIARQHGADLSAIARKHHREAA